MSILSRIGSRSTVSKDHKCTIRLLDDSETVDLDFSKNHTGQYLLDYVCDYLNIIERDYFGIRYMDSSKQRYWLDPTKLVLKQIKGQVPLVFSFRVKYYPSDPSILQEEVTRYQLFLQLRRDLLHGRLYCPPNDAALLGAYIVQSELGDYDPEEHKDAYVSEFKLLLKQTAKLEEKIAQIHRTLAGQVPATAEAHFLAKACTLDTYGFDPFTVRIGHGHGSSKAQDATVAAAVGKEDKESKQGQVYLGVTFQGVLVYQLNRKLYHIEWNDIDKVDYIGKEYVITLKPHVVLNKVIEQFRINGHMANGDVSTANGDASNVTNGKAAPSSPKSSEKEKVRIVFKCPSATFCKHLWKYTLDQKAFFTSPHAADVKPQTSKSRFFFKRGSTFRFSGRVQNEAKEITPPPDRVVPPVNRYHVQRQPSMNDRLPPVRSYGTLPARLRPESIYRLQHDELPEMKVPPLFTVQTFVPSSEAAPTELQQHAEEQIKTPSTDEGFSNGGSYPESPVEGGSTSFNDSNIIDMSAGEPNVSADSNNNTTADFSVCELVVNGQVVPHYEVESVSYEQDQPIKSEATNGHVMHSPVANRKREGGGPCASVLKFLLGMIVLAMITALLLVFVMESKDPTIQDLLKQYDLIDHIRPHYLRWRAHVLH